MQERTLGLVPDGSKSGCLKLEEVLFRLQVLRDAHVVSVNAAPDEASRQMAVGAVHAYATAIELVTQGLADVGPGERYENGQVVYSAAYL